MITKGGVSNNHLIYFYVQPANCGDGNARGRGNSAIVEEGTWVVMVFQIVSFFHSPLPTQGKSSGSNSFQRPFRFINKGTQKKNI